MDEGKIKNMALAVNMFNNLLIKATGGLSTQFVERAADVENAVRGAFNTFDGIELYPSRADKASHIAYTIIHDHPFYDGNKRTGILAYLVYMAANGENYTYDDVFLVNAALKVAKGEWSESEFRNMMNTYRLETSKIARVFSNAISEKLENSYWPAVEILASAFISYYSRVFELLA